MRRGERQKREPEITLRPMTDKILKNLVTEAVSLDREINEKANQLKELKAQLVAEARGREGELARTDGGGTRWTAEGSDGSIARVNFPAPTLKSKVEWERKAHRKDQKSRRYPVRSALHPHDRL
jgi:hypothetical protein